MPLGGYRGAEYANDTDLIVPPNMFSLNLRNPRSVA